jgi:UDP-3-O-[3-hydroxymyristoyl] glucosamine N-acyltransferase
MKLTESITIKQMAAFLGCDFQGDENILITGINEIHTVEKGDIVFVDHEKYYKKALNSAADVILIDTEVDVPPGKGIIISPTPFDEFNKITRHYSPFKQWNSLTGDNFKIGDSSILHPNVCVGHNVTIGENSVIHAGAILGDNTWIGDHVVIGPNCVIGFDAFYYKKKDAGYDRMHSCGRTVIHNKVEIGALTTIDKGVTGDTIIGEGTKIDNKVHVGHDTVIGKGCLFAANVGVAGCVIIEDSVTLWGQVGVTADIVIGEGATVGAQSGVSKNLAGGAVYIGSPASEARRALKEYAAIKKLPSILENL